MRKQILGLALRYRGEWEKITEGLKQGEKPPCPAIAAPYVTWADAEYPALLRQLRFPPWILFYQGNLALAGNGDRRFPTGLPLWLNDDGTLLRSVKGRSDRQRAGAGD